GIKLLTRFQISLKFFLQNSHKFFLPSCDKLFKILTINRPIEWKLANMTELRFVIRPLFFFSQWFHWDICFEYLLKSWCILLKIVKEFFDGVKSMVFFSNVL